MTASQRHLPEDRFFDPDPAQRRVARELYATVAGLPIVSPHGHVDPRLLADPDATFGTPADLLIIPDHYVFRMLYSQGIPLEALGVPRADGGPVEQDPRKIWQLFADHYHLFRGTPSGAWLDQELVEVFGIDEKLSGANAQAVYDALKARLAQPEYRPRALFERFNIELLATTDAATDRLEHHRRIRESGWGGRVVPTFRPDAVVNLLRRLGEQHRGARRSVGPGNRELCGVRVGARAEPGVLQGDGRDRDRPCCRDRVHRAARCRRGRGDLCRGPCGALPPRRTAGASMGTCWSRWPA